MPNKLDLTGRVFGKLTAIEPAPKANQKDRTKWLCRCECGNTAISATGDLNFGKINSCGCVKIGNRRDIQGQKFGKLTAIASTDLRDGSNILWLCKCECGGEKLVSVNKLRSGLVKSCGCLKKIAHRFTHKMSGTGTYRTWAHMTARCRNPNNKDFHHYGGRGISVCDRWVNSFEAFFEDMGSPPSAKHSIERKDTNGGYSPENCLWATQDVQTRNKRNNRRITIDNETKCLEDWLEFYNYPVTKTTFYRRVKKGMSDVEALLTPYRKAKLARNDRVPTPSDCTETC